MVGCNCRVRWFANGHLGEGVADVIALLDGNILLISPDQANASFGIA